VYSYQYGKINLKNFADTTDEQGFIFWGIIDDLLEDRDSIVDIKLFNGKDEIIQNHSIGHHFQRSMP